MKAFGRQALVPSGVVGVPRSMNRQEMLERQMQLWAQRQQQMANPGQQKIIVGQQLGDLLLDAEDPNKEEEGTREHRPGLVGQLIPAVRNYYRGFQRQKQAPPVHRSDWQPRQHHRQEYQTNVVHHNVGPQSSSRNGIPVHGKQFQPVV